METYLSNLQKITPSTKEELLNWSEQLKTELTNGEIDGLEAKRLFVMLQKLLENIKDTVDEMALNEALKYGQKSFEAKGMKLEIKETGSKYDFSNCNDPVFIDLSLKKERADSELKEREKFLKAITKPTDIILEGGEVATVVAPVKFSNTSVVAILK